MKASAFEQAIRRFAGSGTILHRLLTWFTPAKLRQQMQNHLTLSVDITKRRLEQGTGHKDLMFHILRQQEARGEITADEILINSAVLMSVPC